MLFIWHCQTVRMETNCEHRWRYFIHVVSRSVRVRECERCGRRSLIPTELAPMPRTLPAHRRPA